LAIEFGPQRVLNRIGVLDREIAIRLREGRQQAPVRSTIDQAIDGGLDQDSHWRVPRNRTWLHTRYGYEDYLHHHPVTTRPPSCRKHYHLSDARPNHIRILNSANLIPCKGQRAGHETAASSTPPAANDNPQPQGAEQSSHDDNSPLEALPATGTE
jgi:hypothetical protein